MKIHIYQNKQQSVSSIRVDFALEIPHFKFIISHVHIDECVNMKLFSVFYMSVL